MTVHTADSPNSASVDIIKLGHPDFTMTPFVSIPVQYIAEGPDAVGGVSIELKLNNRGKTIKYAKLYVTALNQLGDPAPCTVHQEATRVLSITGPIDAEKNSDKLIFETVWYNSTITEAVLSQMIVEYTDGSKELYDYTIKKSRNTSSSKTRTITVTRKWRYVGCAVRAKVYKDNVEVFQLKVGETDSFVTDNQPFELRVELKGNPGRSRYMVEAGEDDRNLEIYVAASGKFKIQEA